MIPGTIRTWQTKSWQEQLNALITDPKVLLERLNLNQGLLPAAQKAAELFPLRVTSAYVDRIEKGNERDPLLKQVLPLDAELNTVEGYVDDPLLEAQANPTPGLVHKYQNRVLMIAASQCAINCRYCFRRAFPYSANTPGRADWEAAAKYTEANKDINEVILSGGDPLVLGDKQLQRIMDLFVNIGHVKRLRIHTRLPIVLPDRITTNLLDTLSNTRLKTVMVIHSNHPQEIDQAVMHALSETHTAGITLFNQSVLLRGVNDNLETLSQLSERLFEANTVPYYLHVLDKVTGASHFDLPTKTAVALHKSLTAALPGYLVPKLVREIAGEPSKTAIY